MTPLENFLSATKGTESHQRICIHYKLSLPLYSDQIWRQWLTSFTWPRLRSVKQWKGNTNVAAFYKRNGQEGENNTSIVRGQVYWMVKVDLDWSSCQSVKFRLRWSVTVVPILYFLGENLLAIDNNLQRYYSRIRPSSDQREVSLNGEL